MVKNNKIQKLVDAIPLYKRIYYELKDDILSCHYKPNSKLDSEKTLTARYNVSRHTLQQALKLLENEGLILRQQGKATLVRSINKTGQDCEVIRLGCINQASVLLTQYCQIFADRVYQVTNGALQIEVHHSSVFGNGGEQLKKVISGELDIFCCGTEWLTELDPIWNLVSYPFVFSDLDHVINVVEQEESASIRDSLIYQYGIRMIGYNWYRPSRLIISKKPCLHEEDIIGLKIGIPPIKMYHKVWRTLGAVPVEVLLEERKQALKDGRIDATDLNWDIILEEDLHKEAKYATLTNHLFARVSLLMNEKKFSSFRPDIRKVLLDVCHETGDLFTKKIFDSFESDKKKLLNYDMRFTEANFKGWHKKVDKIVRNSIKPDSLEMSIYERIKNAGKVE